METEKLQLSSLPEVMIDRVCDHILKYAVGLSGITVAHNKEKYRLIGSGTLVTIAGQHCILTADHVLAELRSCEQLAVLTRFDGELRRHAFPLSHLKIHRVAKGQDDSCGPDVGLIALPETGIGSILSEKVFFNIEKRKERFANGFIAKDQGFWFTLGILGESEQIRGSERGFTSVKSYLAICGVAADPGEYEEGGFDYLELRMNYRDEKADLPSSFGGCSGGGVWQVPIRKNKDGALQEEEHLLSGLVFYQSTIGDGVRFLKCHGRKTVYQRVPRYIHDQIGR